MFSDQIFASPFANAVLSNARKALFNAAFPTPPKTAPYLSFTKAAAMSVLTRDSIPATPNTRNPYAVPVWARTRTAMKSRLPAEALMRGKAENAREQAKALECKQSHRIEVGEPPR
jgi:hypothetical protein